MKIMTCNIRTSLARRDGENAWLCRKSRLAAVLREQNADIVCFQEMTADQFGYLSSSFPEYNAFAMTDEPCGTRPQNCIFYRQAAYVQVAAGGYWLSETPHLAGTKSWNSACIRFANWVRLFDRRAGTEFRVVNTHLDCDSQLAREKQAEIIVADAGAYPRAYPQLLTGDMNCDFRNAAIGNLKRGGWVDTYAAVHQAEYAGHTRHDYLGATCRSEVGKIDWIFMRGKISATSAAVITTAVDGKYPSDHYFVSATCAVERAGNP